MKKITDNLALPQWLRGWEQFWFTPADPSLLGLMRICCGMIVVYTLFAYSFSLQEMMGEHAWNDMQLRMSQVREHPVIVPSINWSNIAPTPQPRNEFEREYLEDYKRKFAMLPPPPYPINQEQADMLETFRNTFGIDMRVNGLPPPRTEAELEYAKEYTRNHNITPPPAYPKDEAEAEAIERYIERYGTDPRIVYTKGQRVFSLWFHVLDPNAMWTVHILIVFVSILFTIGFATRITAAALWFGSLNYIQRNPTMVFGVDTMMTIMLLYLMIGPSGAAFSVDNVIRRWWVKAKPGFVQAWYRWRRQPVPSIADIEPAAPVEIVPSVSANLAIRLLQIHVGIIYLIAGVSKLLGNSWWTGEALWGTLGNFEFAPMQFEIYRSFLAFIGQYQWLYALIMTGGGLFTLAFEIGYIFLIWQPRLRWVFLAAAILLHGFIGLFMGLKTFSMMMLVMNMAFLKKEEVYAFIRMIGLNPAAPPAPPAAPPPKLETAIASAKS
ncbi:MAG TPA: hypothetical protein VFE62_18780 [Gemmataceae bacterium]|nr:hypothetical protein [Gemmataceae bacterium]